MSTKHLIVIAGPTASGKTALAVQLAKHFQTSVFSADSRQFYREIAIGTAKPSLEEMQGVQHYFIDSHSIHTPLSASVYADEALKLLDLEFETKDVVVLVGGSGLFIDALCVGLDTIPFNPTIREELNRELKEFGLELLQQELLVKDPVFYSQVDLQNSTRIIRALEVIRNTGNTFSHYINSDTKPKRNFTFSSYVINHPREELYRRIEFRVDEMMRLGLLDEVKSVCGFRNLQTLNTVGYSELFKYLDGEITLDTAISLIKQNTRRYAKRQLTWFRNRTESYWLQSLNKEEQLVEIIERESITKK
jgi:tRNA dimethylallyltransferase